MEWRFFSFLCVQGIILLTDAVFFSFLLLAGLLSDSDSFFGVPRSYLFRTHE
jgi:hypothetical protein